MEQDEDETGTEKKEQEEDSKDGTTKAVEDEEEVPQLRLENIRLKRELEEVKTELEEMREECLRLKEKMERMEAQTETKEDEDEADGGWDNDGGKSLADQVREAAQEEQLRQQGMVREETTGLWYDYKSGYYYDSERGRYYDGNRGKWITYNYETGEYEEDQSEEDPGEGEMGERKMRRRRKKNEKREKKEKKEKVKERDKREEEEGDDLEEGEVQDEEESSEESVVVVESDESDTEDERTNGEESPVEEEAEEEVPPCIRMVVKSSESCRIGSLFIITCMGGSIGREGDREVILEDQGCSKKHARVDYHKGGRFFIKDLGSRNGTFVNEKRISSEVEGERTEVGHGSRIKIGTTDLVCHVHPGTETCFECEPGLMMQEVPKTPVVLSKSKESTRKQDLKAMKRKYAINDFEGDDGPVNKNAKYSDRAGLRRKEKGSDNPYEKTESSHVDVAIKKSNKGFSLLSKMGWKEGEGLGKTIKGRTEPVKVEVREQRAGLGASAGEAGMAASMAMGFKARERAGNLKKTQERFSRTKEGDAFAEEKANDDGVD